MPPRDSMSDLTTIDTITMIMSAAAIILNVVALITRSRE